MATSLALSSSLVSALRVFPSSSSHFDGSVGRVAIRRKDAKRAKSGPVLPLVVTTAESVLTKDAPVKKTDYSQQAQFKPDNQQAQIKPVDTQQAQIKPADTQQAQFEPDLQHSKFKRVVNVPRRNPKPRVILISGPTAVGKTGLSIELAKSLGGEIVNADSVQVYQGLDIGAAKAPMEERQGVPHHVMDLVLPTVDYTTEDFVVDARAATEEILSKGKVPIVIGGTGLYMRSFMHNRVGMTSHRFEEECELGDEECDADWDWDYDFQAYFLYQHRADLFPRVDIRCEMMIPALLDETTWLMSLGVRPGSHIASAAIGYDEAMQLFLEARETDGVITEKRFLQFIRLFMHNSKGLVKKQIAWFRKEERSDVRKFRWIQAGQDNRDKMVKLLIDEYRRPAWKTTSELPSGEDLKAASMREQKRLKDYKPRIKMYTDPNLVASALAQIKRHCDDLFPTGGEFFRP